jgi:CBS domain-containing protein
MIRVTDVMTPDPITVRPSDNVRVAKEDMEEHRMRSLL